MVHDDRLPHRPAIVLVAPAVRSAISMKQGWLSLICPAERYLLAISDEAHSHSRSLADHLTCEPLGAGPRLETPVIVGGASVLLIALRAPAVLVFGSGEFGAAAQLRSAGKSAGVIRVPAVAHRGENIAAADLVAKEMRRRRHHSGIVGLGRHPVDAGEMKAADAAGLMAARTGHVVEPALKACDRADILQRHAAFRCLLQGRDDIRFPEYRVSRAITLHQAERRLQVRGRKSDWRRGDSAGGEKLLRYQNRAAIQLAEMPGIEQPRLELAPALCIRQNPFAIDLVFERRLLKHPGLRVVVKQLQEIVGAEIADIRFRRVRDLK